MKPESETPSLALHHHVDDEEACATVLAGAVSARPGIVKVEFDPDEAEVAFAYDPRVVDEQDILEVAEAVGPTLRGRWSTCTMRLGRQGGRACETCALALEKRLGEIAGVRHATVSFLGGALSIAYDDALLSEERLEQEVRRLGVRAEPVAAPAAPTAPVSGWRLWLTADRLALLFTVITSVAMVAGFVGERLQAPVPFLVTAYTVAYVAGGAFGLKAGLESLRALTIDVDLLMILAALGAAVVGAPFEGAMLLFLFSLSNVLQNYALDRTRNAIRSLMALRPEEALVRRGSRLVTLAIEQVEIGDRMVVRPGDRIALDGVVLEGRSSVDQASITGESMPVHKGEGDKVLAGTINQKGSLEVGVTHLAQDSTIARLIQLVEEAHSEKAKTQRFIDRAEQYYALGVIVLTAAALAVPVLLLGHAFGPSFYRAMTLMVAASPCALVISTPATVLSAIGNGARKGILFKGGAYVEQAAEIKVIAFDKTGTLTLGRPQVTDVVVADSLAQDELLALAASVEEKSEHPLAQAIVTRAQERGLQWPQAQGFQSDTGRGVMANVGDRVIAVGNRRYFRDFETEGLARAGDAMDRLHDQGKTAVVVAQIEGQIAHILGVVGIADILRPDAPAVVRALKARGVERVVMLTGDNERVAQAIASEAGVDGYHAELLPEDKMRILQQEAAFGPVAMVGDGVNDAPALATATIGIAMGAAGTDVALETADIVLMADDLGKLPYLIGLSHKTRRTLIQNLVFATGMIAILIGAVLGFSLALPLSVIGHEGSTVLVSLNGLRLLGYNEGGLD